MKFTKMIAALKSATYSPVCKPTLITLLAAIALLPACSTVSVDKQTSAKVISAQRGNIITGNNLSSATAAALFSAGLNEQACMQYLELCLDQLTDSLLNDNYRSSLASFAELHYAKARKLADSQNCRNVFARPPLDPYYANAPSDPEEVAIQKDNTDLCLVDYQARLFDAVKFSYAYLFYDALDHDFDGADRDSNKKPKQHRIPSDIDIQTQDIYNAASNDVITQLYRSSEDSSSLIGNTKVTYMPTMTAIDNNRQAALQDRALFSGAVTDQINVMKMQVNNYNLNVYLPNEDDYLQNAHKQASALADLVSTYEIRFSGLNSISKRPGLGVSMVASLNDRYTTTVRQLLSKTPTKTQENDDDINSRIYPTGHLLITGLIKPDGDSVLDVLGSQELNIHLYNPYNTESVSILGEDYPLAANFSAGYGMWLAENQLNSAGYLNLLARKQDANLPKLFMLEPYDPNKRVIIMVHGLASSPATWVNLTNDIFNDRKLRDNYQVWQVFYPTNLPILENRYQIQELIKAAYQQTDPSGTNRASNSSVVISHSMGALIARMMLSDDNLGSNLDVLELDDKKLLSNSNEYEIDDTLIQAFINDDIGKRLELESLPQVDTAVFLSAPFKGTDYADRWFTRAVRRVIYLPVGLVKTVTDNLSTIATQGDLAQNPLGALYLQNGASQLSNKSSFIELTKDLKISDRITYHSIIANKDTDIVKGLAEMQLNSAKIDLSKAVPDSDSIYGNPSKVATDTVDTDPLIAAVTINDNISEALTAQLSDGIVPYTSAHLDGAASETVISGGHSIQESPQTILTLRRILHQQLQQ